MVQRFCPNPPLSLRFSISVATSRSIASRCESIISRFAPMLKSGKRTLDYKTTLRTLHSCNIKLTFLSANCPPLGCSKFEYNTMIDGIDVPRDRGSKIDLDTACNKCFCGSMLCMMDVNDSDILAAGDEKGERQRQGKRQRQRKRQRLGQSRFFINIIIRPSLRINPHYFRLHDSMYFDASVVIGVPASWHISVGAHVLCVVSHPWCFSSLTHKSSLASLKGAAENLWPIWPFRQKVFPFRASRPEIQ